MANNVMQPIGIKNKKKKKPSFLMKFFMSKKYTPPSIGSAQIAIAKHKKQNQKILKQTK